MRRCCSRSSFHGLAFALCMHLHCAVFSSQRVGGAFFVDVGSNLDVTNKVTFLGNSIAFFDDTNGNLNWVRCACTVHCATNLPAQRKRRIAHSCAHDILWWYVSRTRS